MKRSLRDFLKSREGRKDFAFLPQISVRANVREALRALRVYYSGALIVMDGSEVVGIFSERDFAQWALENSEDIRIDACISEMMTRKVAYVTPEYRLEECLDIMKALHIRHLPVMEDKRPVALLSMRHIMEALIEDREFQVDEMVKYITGSSFLHRERPSSRSPQILFTVH